MKYEDVRYELPVPDRKGSGVFEFILHSWTQFHVVVNRFLDNPEWIFRGHRKNTWKLEPTLVRLVKARPDYEALIKIHLEKFKYALRGRRGTNPPPLESDYDVFALEQHSGLATPLLDWTTSPYVALFFAFAKNVPDDSTESRTVFCLHEMQIRDINKEVKEDPWIEDVIDFHRPLSDENPRLVNQSGLFTVSTGITDIETWVRRNWRDKKSKPKGVLLKIQIPNNDRQECLKALNKMNINYASLFPDIQGACKHDA